MLKMRPNNTVHAYINWAIVITMKLHATRCKLSNLMIVLHSSATVNSSQWWLRATYTAMSTSMITKYMSSSQTCCT